MVALLKFPMSRLNLIGLVIVCTATCSAQAAEKTIFEQVHDGSLKEIEVRRDLTLKAGTYEVQVDFVGGVSRGGKVELELEVDGKEIEDLVTRKSIDNIRRRFDVSNQLELEFEAVGAPVDRIRLVEITAQ